MKIISFTLKPLELIGKVAMEINFHFPELKIWFLLLVYATITFIVFYTFEISFGSYGFISFIPVLLIALLFKSGKTGHMC